MGYVGRDHEDGPLDEANTANMVDDSMDEHIAGRVDDTVAAESSCKKDAVVVEPTGRSVAVGQVRIDIAGRSLDWAASSEEYVDSSPVLAVASPEYPECLAPLDVVA